MKIERITPKLEAIEQEYWTDMQLIRKGWQLLDQCETETGMQLTYDTGAGVFVEELHHDGSRRLTRVMVIQP